MDFENLTPEQIEQLMALGVIPEKQGNLQDQIKTAEAVRYGEAPKGTYTGRTYVAANPLQHLGDFMQKRQAGKDLGSLRTKQDELMQQQVEARKQFFNSLRGKTPGATPPINPTYGPKPFPEGGML